MVRNSTHSHKNISPQWLFSLKIQRQEMERKWWESRSLLCSSFNLLAAAVLYASLHFFLVSSPLSGILHGLMLWWVTEMRAFVHWAGRGDRRHQGRLNLLSLAADAGGRREGAERSVKHWGSSDHQGAPKCQKSQPPSPAPPPQETQTLQ